ncbi:MFS transporter [Streptacidiphilus sp. P02-A3a]|uniref:MFS transporter n=1 Tax=Streptacidiphilus sp. P02-A3a TaxID=2704468 RepID=UPI0015FD56C1|nr:MFS transporter [Streptacidiphilus sp. P02-A3a]QMU72193.1 MFS transporter [Streptacidiphilus sp. P02-A3a]
MPRPSRGSASYRAVLALPHARALFTAATLARLGYGLLGLPLLLSVHAGTGSYAVAGTASGLFGLVGAVVGPARARLVERRPGTLPLLATGYTALLALTALAGAVGVAPWLAITLVATAGAIAPPVGPLARTRWGVLAADQAQRQCALSLDTVGESTAFAVGPALGGGLIATASAPLALAVCAGLTAVGFSALAAVLRRAPAPGRAAAAGPGTDAARPPLRAPGLAAALAAVTGSGCALAVLEIAAVATWGAAATGWLLALSSLGGVVGGLVYGRQGWSLPLGRRLTLLAAAGAGCYALPALAPLLPVAAPALLAAGAFGDTLLITAYLLVDERVAAGARTEAGAWVNTGYNLGSALGSGGAGMLLDAAGHRAVLLAAAVAAGAGALGAVASGRGALHSPPAAGAGSGADDGDLADAELLDRRGN